jgi:hypothetical protein
MPLTYAVLRRVEALTSRDARRPYDYAVSFFLPEGEGMVR